MYKKVSVMLLGLGLAFAPLMRAEDKSPPNAANNVAPAGFTTLFDGKTLEGWRGRQGDLSEYKEADYTPEKHATEQAKWNTDKDKHWKVDAAKGEIVSDGHGVFLATDKNYGDFEMYVDWLMVSHNGDSGIYLRDYPQVQIWDPDNKSVEKYGAAKGSGALWNNNADNPGKWPLVKADNPIGEWNTFHIKMIDNKVWVWFNDKLTVDGQVLDNIYDRKRKINDTGAIELQTHGSEMHFRNIFVKELPKEQDKK